MFRFRNVILFVLLVISVGIGLLAFIPANGKFAGAPFRPAPAPAFEGVMATNKLLQEGYYIGEGELEGPEELAVGPDGKIYTGVGDGWVKRFTLEGEIEDVVNTGGRPVGLDFHPDGTLYVADAYKGLLKLNDDGTLETVADKIEGKPIAGFLDGVRAGSDGYIYVTLASEKYPLHEYLYDLLETQPNGKLMRYDPSTGNFDVLADGLYFPNGIGFAPNGEYLLVGETATYQISRYWLKGDKAGTVDIFADNLPGFPDGVNFDSDGNVLVSLSTKRNAELDGMHPYPALKNIFLKIPDSMRPPVERYALLITMSPEGEIIKSYHDPEGTKATVITASVEHENKLVLGSFEDHQVLVIDK